MAAEKPKKNAKRRVMTLELSWVQVALLVVILVATYGGMFLMGFFTGKGLSPASIDPDTLAKRLVSYLGKPGSDDAAPKKSIPERDSERKSLDFYDTLEKKDAAQSPKRPRKRSAARTEAPKAEAAKTEAVKAEAADDSGVYLIQVSALRSPERAAGLAGELDAKGFPARVVGVSLAGKGTVFRVLLKGEFSLAQARATAKRLRDEEGHKPFLVKSR